MLRLGKNDLKDKYAIVLGGGKFGAIAVRFLVECGSKIIIVPSR